MRERILKFLDAIDTWLVSQAEEGQRLDLYVIGKAAVILFYGGDQAGAMTSDVDVVQISHPPRHCCQLHLSNSVEKLLLRKRTTSTLRLC